MTFTDDDLKLLKQFTEHMELLPPMFVDGNFKFSEMIKALLARMEAAEKVCLLDSRQYEHGCHDVKCCDVCQALEIWRKAAGK